MFNVNIKNTRRRQWLVLVFLLLTLSIFHTFLVFPLLTLNKLMLTFLIQETCDQSLCLIFKQHLFTE